MTISEIIQLLWKEIEYYKNNSKYQESIVLIDFGLSILNKELQESQYQKLQIVLNDKEVNNA